MSLVLLETITNEPRLISSVVAGLFRKIQLFYVHHISHNVAIMRVVILGASCPSSFRNLINHAIIHCVITTSRLVVRQIPRGPLLKIFTIINIKILWFTFYLIHIFVYISNLVFLIRIWLNLLQVQCFRNCEVVWWSGMVDLQNMPYIPNSILVIELLWMAAIFSSLSRATCRDLPLPWYPSGGVVGG